MAAKTSNAKVIEAIMAATGCSDEDTKAMLQLHNGDVNAATIALLESPFQKVDSAVHKKAAKPVANHREQAGPRHGDRPANGSGKRDSTARGGRGEERNRAPPSGGRGGGPSAVRPVARVQHIKIDKTAAERPLEQSTTAYDVYDGTTNVTATASAGAAWGSSEISSAPKAAAWGSGKKTMAEIIKSQQVPVLAPPMPAAYARPKASVPTPAQDAEVTYESLSHNDSSHHEVAAVGSKPQAAAWGSNAIHADMAKNLLSQITKGSVSTTSASVGASVAPSATAVQPTQPGMTVSALEQALASAEVTAPSPVLPQHYGYQQQQQQQQPKGVLMGTSSELDASIQLSFGNFGLTDFGSNFGQQVEPASSSASAAMPKQQQSVGTQAQEAVAQNMASQQQQQQQQEAAYRASVSNYNSGYGGGYDPHAQSHQAAATFSGFGQTAFVGGFGTGFPGNDAAAYEAFENYQPQASQVAVDALKSNNQSAQFGAGASSVPPGMGSYGGMQQMQQYGQPTGAQSFGSQKPSMYAPPYGQNPQAAPASAVGIDAGPVASSASQQQYGGQQYNHYGAQQYNPNAGNPMAYAGMNYAGYGASGYGGGYQTGGYPSSAYSGYSQGGGGLPAGIPGGVAAHQRTQGSGYNPMAGPYVGAVSGGQPAGAGNVSQLPAVGAAGQQGAVANGQVGIGAGIGASSGYNGNVYGYEDMSAGGGQGGYGAPKAEKEAAGGYQGGGAGGYQPPHLRNNNNYQGGGYTQGYQQGRGGYGGPQAGRQQGGGYGGAYN